MYMAPKNTTGREYLLTEGISFRKKRMIIIQTWLFLEALSMIGILVGFVNVVNFAMSPLLQEAIIHQAISKDPDVAHLYSRQHVALWSWVLCGIFAIGLGI